MLRRWPAEADLAYDLQRYKTEQAVKEQSVQVQIVEKIKQAELEEKEIARKEKELIATVQRPAEAERTRIQTVAEAEQYRLKTTALGQASLNAGEFLMSTRSDGELTVLAPRMR